jgi:TRAP-type C4-dicarboxylate transport system permease small subunit
MGKISARFWNVFDKFIEFLALLGGILVLYITLATVYTIFTRYLKLNPPIWTMQFNEYCLLWLAMLGTTWLLKKDRHTKIDIVITHLNPIGQGVLFIFTSILGGLACLVVVWFSAENLTLLIQRGIIDVNSIDVPKFLPYSIIPPAYFLLTIQFFRGVYTRIKSLMAGTQEIEQPAETPILLT